MIVGAGSSRLPVPVGTALGGYADRTGPASGTLDELEVHAVVLSAATAGPPTLVLVVADLVCVNRDLADAVGAAVGARLGIPDAGVWTLATHTHSGPDVQCGVGPRTTPATWLTAVPVAAAAAAEQAFAARRTAAVQWHVGELHGVGAVRAVVDAPATVPVDALVVSSDGRPSGVLVVLPVHPTVLPAGNRLVSGDLAAAVRRALAERLAVDAEGSAGAAPWVVVATGCAGDISTRATRRDQSPAELARLAELAADQLAPLLRTGPVASAASEGGVRVARRHLRLPVRDDEAPAELVAVGGGSPVADRIAYTLRQGQAVAAERSRRHPDGEVELALAAADVGGIRLLAIGAEPYLGIRELPREPAVVLGYANGYAGYLPDAAGFETATYESLSSPFRPDAAVLAVRAAEDALNQSNPEEHL